MLLIAHRGNLKGKNQRLENTEPYIKEALAEGFDVEVDVWFTSLGWFLGHDSPLHKTTVEFLKTPGLWCHAKSLTTLEALKREGVEKFFWHQEDNATLTSVGVPWCYPGIYLETGVTVMQTANLPPTKVYGVCTDWPVTLRAQLSPQ